MEYNEDNYNLIRSKIANYNDIAPTKEDFENAQELIRFSSNKHKELLNKVNSTRSKDFTKQVGENIRQALGITDKKENLLKKVKEIGFKDPEKLKVLDSILGIKEISSFYGIDFSDINSLDISSKDFSDLFDAIKNPKKMGVCARYAINVKEPKKIFDETYQKAENISKNYEEQQKRLDESFQKINNSKTAKEAYNYKIDAKTGNLTQESVEKVKDLQNLVSQERNSYVEAEIGKHKIPLNEKVNSLVNQEDGLAAYMGLSAEEKAAYWSGYSDSQLEELGFSRKNIGNMTEDEMTKVIENYKNEAYLKTKKARLGSQFDEKMMQDKRFAMLAQKSNKEVLEEGADKVIEKAAGSSKLKTAGKYALGFLAGAYLVNNLFFGDNKGVQTNAQLYGQQPLY